MAQQGLGGEISKLGEVGARWQERLKEEGVVPLCVSCWSSGRAAVGAEGERWGRAL